MLVNDEQFQRCYWRMTFGVARGTLTKYLKPLKLEYEYSGVSKQNTLSELSNGVFHTFLVFESFDTPIDYFQNSIPTTIIGLATVDC